VRAIVHPGGFGGGDASVPGDKSIAHRWLILAATARGRSELRGLPGGLDVKATARCLAALLPAETRAGLDGWASDPGPEADRDRSTTNDPRPRGRDLALEADGRPALETPAGPLDCSNSGTTMRLLAGLVASCAFETVLEGDDSLSSRPMERVADPLRAMGAEVITTGGRPPVVVRGGRLSGIEFRSPVPSAQVKSAVLLAGLAAEGETTVLEPVPTRDHTERVLASLGAPVGVEPGRASVRAFQHDGFAATVPGDVSSAAFLVAAAVVTGASLRVRDVGLNPTRTHYLTVLDRMGAMIEVEVEGEELGEPVGTLEVETGSSLAGTTVEASELPLVIDEVPILALAAAHARGETRFAGASELRLKESDRLSGLAAMIRGLGGTAGVQGEDLVVGGGGLNGGTVDARGDHRMAMAAAVGGLAGRGPSTIDGMESADVSFPEFVPVLRALGATVEG